MYKHKLSVEGALPVVVMTVQITECLAKIYEHNKCWYISLVNDKHFHLSSVILLGGGA